MLNRSVRRPEACRPETRRPETESAISAVRAALEVAVSRDGAEERVSKEWVDFATAADIKAEDAIRRVLLEHHPEIPIVGEERGGDVPPAGSPYWLVDPICGTRNYAANLSLYCVNLALVENGEIHVGVVGDGASGAIEYAERGAGAFRADEEQGRASRLAARDGSIIAIDLAGKPPDVSSAKRVASIVAHLMTDGRHEVRLLSTTLIFEKLASGDFAGLMLLGEVSDPLHTAAGCLLAHEAGAVLTDLEGNPWTLETRGFVGAASPELHRELLELYRAEATA